MPNVGTITGSMVLDPSAYISGLNQSAAATKAFQSGVNGVSFAGFHRGMIASTTLLYGLNRIMSSMSKGMEEYSNMLGRIGSVADLTAASVNALADSIKGLSVAQGVSRRDIMGGMYTAAQSGFSSPAEMRAMATSGAMLSRASGKEINVNKSVDLLSVARQALGIKMDAVSSGRMNDLLLRGRDVGRWELDQMAKALGIPLTVYGNQFAGKIGGEETLRQLVAIMSTATLAGLNPNTTATGTRRLVERTVQLNRTKLGDPLRNALRDRGFGGADPISQALDQGPMAYLNTLLSITGGQTGELSKLGFGSRDLMLLTSAMRGRGGTLNNLYNELSYGNVAGTTERYTEKMRGTYDYTRDRLRSQWEITSQEFMQASVPLIGQFTSMLETFNRVAQSLPDGVKSFMLLMSALTSLRFFLNFLGVRGSLFHQAGGMLGGQSLTGAGVRGVSSGAKRIAAPFLVAAGQNVGYGFDKVATKSYRPFTGYRGSGVSGVAPVQRAIFDERGLALGKNPRDIGIPRSGMAMTSFLNQQRRTRLASKMASGIGAGNRRTYGGMLLPNGFSARQGGRFGGAFSGMGTATGGALGLMGGTVLGGHLEGEDGNGILPFALGSLGGQLGSNLAGAFASQYGGMAGVARAALSVLGRFALPVTVASVAAKGLGGLGEGMTFSAGSKRALDDKWMLKKRSASPAVQGFSNLWNSLPGLTMGAAESVYGSRGWAGDMLRRVWTDPTRGGLYDRFINPKMTDESRGVLAKNGVGGFGDLIGNEKFRAYHTAQFGEKSWDDVSSGSLYRTNPSGWIDLMSDSIRGFTNQLQMSKSATDALVLAERELASARSVAGQDVRGVIGYLSGYKTLFNLESAQTEPFQPKRGAEWLNEYERGTNDFRLRMMSPYYKNPLEGYLGASQTPLFSDADMKARRSEFESVAGTSKDDPYKDVMGLNAKLRTMEFLAKYGPYLSDREKMSDEKLAKGVNLDTKAMTPQMRQRTLESLRSLDYTDWTQTYSPEKAPFSKSLFYGSQEGYNATLDRPEAGFEVKLLTGKLEAIANAIEGTVERNDETQKTFEENLKRIIEDAVQPVVDELRTQSELYFGSTYPSTVET